MSFQRNFGAQQGSFNGVSQLGGLGRQGWNQLNSNNTGPGVNLDPFYRPQRKNSNGGRRRQQGLYGASNGGCRLPQQGLYGASNSYTNGGLRAPMQNMVMTPAQLGAPFIAGQIRGLDREGYQVLISQVSSRFGINAAQAARLLGPLIQSQQEARALTAQEWSQMISNASRQFGVNAAQAAVLLDPYVRGARESVFGASNGFNGYNGGFGFNGNQGRTFGGFESNFGMYEGLRSPSQSFRAGTPAESTDVVLNNNESAGLAMIQAATSPARITNRNGQTFNEVDIARIAQALGIQTQGYNRAALIAAIKGQAGSLSPRSQAQFLGSQSPRSRQFLGGL